MDKIDIFILFMCISAVIGFEVGIMIFLNEIWKTLREIEKKISKK